MGKAKEFELFNPMGRPAKEVDLVGALMAFVNGQDVAIYLQPAPGVVRRWSLWREQPNEAERASQVNALGALIDGSRTSFYGGFQTDADGHRRPTHALLEIQTLPDSYRTREQDLLPDRGFAIYLAHMRASIQQEPVLVSHRLGYSLTEYRAFDNIASVLAVAMLLVTDPARPFAKSLSRCKWCQKFYLAKKNPKGGPANRVYCSSAHRDEHHNSAERKAAQKSRKHR